MQSPEEFRYCPKGQLAVENLRKKVIARRINKKFDDLSRLDEEQRRNRRKKKDTTRKNKE